MSLQFKETKKTIKDEYQLIKNDGDTYLSTLEYLAPLISEALSRIDEFALPEKKKLKIEILDDVARAAQLYLQRVSEHGLPEYHFSTYFGWFMAEKIENFKKIPQ
jgi:hypothetical protein